MRFKSCRVCGKEYEVGGLWPGCCSAKCKKKRRIFLANSRPIIESNTRLNKMQNRASKAFLVSPLWKRLRYEAFRKYGQRCMCCGITNKEAVLQVDHIKPRSRYPELADDINNLQILCRICNCGKSNKYEDDLR
jgi:5-methylcytosine-specific restriction endonuclease McrA